MPHARIRWIVLAMALVLIGPTSNRAQNLAEAARREKERQKQYQAAKVRAYTREDLERLREKARVSTVGTPTASVPPSPAEQPAPPPEKTALPPDVEKEIRQKQAEIQKLRTELANLEAQMNPSMALYRATDFGTLTRRKRELEERIQALEKEIQTLREKASASGGPH